MEPNDAGKEARARASAGHQDILALAAGRRLQCNALASGIGPPDAVMLEKMCA
jgi:hypothetical protein